MVVIEFQLSLDALGNTRFGYSPLGEVASSLRALDNPRARALLRPWLRAIEGPLRAADLDLLRAVVPRGYVAPDFMFAWSADPGVTIEEQLADLLAMPGEARAEDLRETWRNQPAPEPVQPLLVGRGWPHLCDALQRYFYVALRPFWSRIRAAIDDDIAHRVARLLSGGLYEMLAGLHPEVSVRGDVIAIDKPQHPDAAFATPTITLIPSVFVWPQLIVAHSAPDCFELQYGVRGVGRVWDGLATPDVADAFAALVGRTRAANLVKLAAPYSTTELARVLQASPAAVSAHLSVLRRNGLVSATRQGRRVLYRRTALATYILAASESADLPGASA